MSLLPFLLDDSLVRPSRIMDQHFGLVLDPEDLLQPMTVPRMLLRCPAGYIRNWKSTASSDDSGSTVNYGSDKFLANLDVQQFKPEEISVKVTGENTITIEGKHEEKEDEHGHIYRHFVRRYVLPKTYDINKVESKLSSDGVLSICAPKVDGEQIEHKNIPVTQTGEPAKTVDRKCDGDKQNAK
ncbi:protein lethal(2)essential for life-like [Leptinotarsa decemlineata]|uniref:protein lethal(2)essential for life-like n=1 Tax=Leptinotarsa decemlineata TaxID=7539 RepID=UPI000C253D93|nr:protein lethal(2)essential for life-like [Leptinotarsa decemlineata]